MHTYIHQLLNLHIDFIVLLSKRVIAPPLLGFLGCIVLFIPADTHHMQQGLTVDSSSKGWIEFRKIGLDIQKQGALSLHFHFSLPGGLQSYMTSSHWSAFVQLLAPADASYRLSVCIFGIGMYCTLYVSDGQDI